MQVCRSSASAPSILDIPTTLGGSICGPDYHCGLSECPHCQAYKAFKRQKNIRQNIRHRKLFRLVLTIRASFNLTTALDSLYTSFTRLRQTRHWERTVKGGLYNLHVKNNEDGSWNTHFDILIEADGLSSDTLSTSWQTITGDSFILTLQPVGDTATDHVKLTGYQTRSAIRDISHDKQLVKMFTRAIGRRPKFRRFGKWVNTSKEKARWKNPPKRKTTTTPPPVDLPPREADPLLPDIAPDRHKPLQTNDRSISDPSVHLTPSKRHGPFKRTAPMDIDFEMNEKQTEQWGSDPKGEQWDMLKDASGQTSL